jgi:hypothetical protein
MLKLERLLVVLVALHSAVVGGLLMVVPEFAIHFGGWGGASPLFFACQAGIFHLVLAAGYLIEFYLYKGIAFLVTAKAMAVIFLLTATVLGGVPWIVPFSGVTDGLMGLVVLMVHLKVSAGEGR